VGDAFGASCAPPGEHMPPAFQMHMLSLS
jgi:hypothetical protein